MNLRELYEAAIRHGIEVDPRGEERVRHELERAKREFDELGEAERERFDRERLTNPYADSRLLHGDGSIDVESVAVGIDIEVGELLLVDRLRQRGQSVDLAWGHHPEGAALANLSDVMAMQADILSRHGVPINIAEGVLEPRISEVSRRVMPTNHMRAVDAARLLDVPMICTHTAADNCVASYLQDLFDERCPDTVGDVLDVLRGIPEYAEAEAMGSGLKVFAGKKKRRAGRVFVDMTGGTGGSEKTLERIANTCDIGTIVGMHIPEKNREEAEKHHINVVIAGHMASDTLGMNLLIDGVENATGEQLSIIECSGFRRHRH